MICSTGGRWSWGLRRMNRRPVLGTMLTPPAPIDDMNCSTYGSLRTIAATACCFSRMASNEMSWAASVNAKIWPVSSLGMKPFGMARKAQAVTARLAIKLTTVTHRWIITQRRLLS